jgi:hypothetical protein
MTGIAAINVQPNAGTGEITVTASSPGLEPSSVRIRSVEAKITADNR